MLMSLEGNVGRPYLDSAGVLTDCYGNTKNVRRDHVRTMQECIALLNGEAGRIANMVYTDIPTLTWYQLAAITSFVYNIGDTAWKNSTSRRKFKAGDSYGGCNEFYRWNKITVGGVKVVLEGLNNRRKKEVPVCLGDTSALEYWQSRSTQ